MPRRALLPAQLNKPLPIPIPSNKPLPTAARAPPQSPRAATRAASPRLTFPSSPKEPDSPIPLISIDASLLVDGGSPHAHSAATHVAQRRSSLLHARGFTPSPSPTTTTRKHTPPSRTPPSSGPTSSRATTRLTTASALSLLDFLESEEAEMRGEVQRVLRRMREVKRAVRAVKRERGLMKSAREASGRERFADSEAEVTVGAGSSSG